jgi:hypothetical protein
MPQIDPICLLYAPVVSWVVDFLKRVPFLARYPKIIALFLTLALSYLQAHPSPGQAFPISQLVACVLTTLAGTVATHEIVSEPLHISDMLMGKPDRA